MFRFSRALLVFVGFVGPVSLFLSGESRADEPTQSRFYREYPRSCERLQRAYGRVEAIGVVNQPVDPSGPHRERLINVVVRDHLRKMEISDCDFDKGQKVRVDHDYVYSVGRAASFEIWRDPSKSRSYTLMQLEKGASEPDSPGRVAGLFDNSGGSLIFSPWKTPALSVPALLNRATYRLGGFQQLTTTEGEKLVRIDFSNMIQGQGTLEGFVYLLPDRCWALRQMELTSKVSAAARIPDSLGYQLYLDVRYGEDRDGIPLVNQVYRRDPMQTAQVNFREVRLGGDIPERAFELPYYSLPDLTRPPADPARSFLAYWLFGVGLIALLVGLVLRRRG